MNEPLKVWIGWDPRDDLAYKVCERSLREHSSIPLAVNPLKDFELRRKGVYWRPYRVDEHGQMFDERDGKPFSTQFSFTRFCVPALEEYDSGWALFCDADMLWRADVAELVKMLDEDMAVMCVQHDHKPNEDTKMDGMIQTAYERKNWSSLMFFNTWKCRALTKYAVNNKPGSWLHGIRWAEDVEIGAFPPEWNWLVGYSPPEIDPKVVHFTLGTPDMGRNDDPKWNKEWYAVLRET